MQFFKPKKNNKPVAAGLFKTKIADRIYSEAEFRRVIDRERARADRTERHFSLIVLDFGQSNGDHKSQSLLLQKLLSRMRRIDEIGWYDPRRIGIILPYTSEKGAQIFTEGLSQLIDPSMTECVFNLFTYGTGSNGIEDLTPENISNR